jgi:hypothetical protein
MSSAGSADYNTYDDVVTAKYDKANYTTEYMRCVTKMMLVTYGVKGGLGIGRKNWFKH